MPPFYSLQAYNKALIQRYKHMPEVRQVVKRRNLPAAIYKVRTASSKAQSFSMLCGCARWIRRVVVYEA